MSNKVFCPIVPSCPFPQYYLYTLTLLHQITWYLQMRIHGYYLVKLSTYMTNIEEQWTVFLGQRYQMVGEEGEGSREDMDGEGAWRWGRPEIWGGAPVGQILNWTRMECYIWVVLGWDVLGPRHPSGLWGWRAGILESWRCFQHGNYNAGRPCAA